MLGYSEAGSAFVFGDYWARRQVAAASTGQRIFAFQVLPIIIFIASFFSILYYLGIMQWIVKAFAIGMQKIMGASGAESLNVAASIFMGQTEAPLTIRPFLAGLTRIGVVHHHGERHGARFGRGDGGLRADSRMWRSSTC